MINREQLLQMGKNVWPFSIVKGFNDLLDLTAFDLWQLYDIALKFGEPKFDFFGKPGIFFSHFELAIELYNFLDNGIGGGVGFMVGKVRPSRITENGSFMLTLMNDIDVIWDRGHTTDDARRKIYEIDRIAYAQNLIVGGQRQFLFS